MIDISCACGKTYRVQQGPVEKRAKCKNCGALLTIAKAPLENSADMDGELPWVQAATVAPAPTKKCPACAELVKAEAVKCKHCGSALLSDKQSQLLKNQQRFSLTLGYMLQLGGLAWLIYLPSVVGMPKSFSPTGDLYWWISFGGGCIISITGLFLVVPISAAREFKRLGKR
jgi:hypothetical protein